MKIVRLTDSYDFKPFDCGEDDLNEFLLNDAKLYAQGYSSHVLRFNSTYLTVLPHS